MKDNSLYRLGSIASILVGVSYVVVGITIGQSFTHRQEHRPMVLWVYG